MAIPEIPLNLNGGGGGFGNALLTGTHARYYAQKADLEGAEAAREAAAAPDVLPAVQGNKDAMARVIANDPKRAAIIEQALGRMGANQRADMKAKADYAAMGANAVLQANPADRPAIYKQVYDQGVKLGYDMSTMPPEYTPAIDPILRTHRATSMEILKFNQKQEEEQGRNTRHNNPTSVGGGSLSPLPGAPAPSPAASPAAGARVSELTPGATPPYLPTSTAEAITPPQPPVQTAQVAPGTAQGSVIAAPETHAQSPGPLKPEGVTQGSPPVGAPAQPNRAGSIFYEDPETHGFVKAQNSKQPGVQYMDDKGYLYYFDPKTKESVRWNPQIRPLQTERALPPAGYRHAEGGGLEFIPGGPYDPANIRRAAPMNNEQARDAGFADRMANSNGLLDNLQVQGGKFWERISEKAPTAVQGFVQTPEYQQFRQARDDFINAQLRRESGAAINADEYVKADKQYFPQPGDSREVVAQKALNRKIAVEAMIRGAGPTYQASPSVGTSAAPAPKVRPPLSSFQK